MKNLRFLLLTAVIYCFSLSVLAEVEETETFNLHLMTEIENPWEANQSLNGVSIVRNDKYGKYVVTMSFATGDGSNAPEYKLNAAGSASSIGTYYAVWIYNGNTLTITSTKDYAITKVAFTFSAASTAAREGKLGYEFSPSGTSYGWVDGTGDVWKGYAQELVLKNTHPKTAHYEIRSIKVTLTPLTVFNEGDNNTIEASEGVHVKLNRTLSSSNWNTFCVPFNIEDITEYGQVLEYTGFDTENNCYLFGAASSIAAGKPYLVKPAEDIVNPIYYGVNITNTDPTTTKVTYNTDYSFVGNYNPTALATDGSERFLGSGNKIYKPSSTSSNIKGFRAYFQMPVGAPAARAMILDEGGETTWINFAEIDCAPKTMQQVYNLQGMLVGNTLEGLPTGLYIVNGKKHLVK